MEGKLVPQHDPSQRPTGRLVCTGCELWNCWHDRGELCDATGCQCGTVSKVYEDIDEMFDDLESDAD